MGVASYREDDLTRFLEATEPPVRSQPWFPRHYCPFCGDVFDDGPKLQTHLSEKHHGERPVLIVAGREPDAIATINQSPKDGEVVVENCTSIRLRQNGRQIVDPSPQALYTLLSNETDAILDIELVNQFDVAANPIRQPYRLTLRVPTKMSLDDADRAFLKRLATGSPHMSQVSEFLDDERCQGVVREYADALAIYVRGLLVKDQAVGTGVTLRPAEANELYLQALDILKKFLRPLPIVICGLVRLAVNDFNAVRQITGFARLDRCNAILSPLAGKRPAQALHQDRRERGKFIQLCPVDQVIDRILDLSDRLDRQTRWGPALAEECRQASDSHRLTAGDQEKVLALWAVTAVRLGAAAEAQEPLRRLRNRYPFGDQAANILDRMEA